MDTSSLQTTAGYRPPPNFAQKIGLLNQNPVLPQKVNINNVDPAYRDYYQAYNDSLDTLTGQAENNRKQATLGQQDVQNAYNYATTGAENAYKSNLAGIQSANQDAQLANRLRARAVGGAPSSGFLDLANRTDVQSQKDIGAAGAQLGQAYQGADLTAEQSLSKIIGDLNNSILQIQQNGQLSLRQRDNAIAQAKAKAAQDAYMASLLGGGQGNGGGNPAATSAAEPQLTVDIPDTPAGQVQGVSTTRIQPDFVQGKFSAPSQLVGDRNVFNNGIPWYQDLANILGVGQQQSYGGVQLPSLTF